MLDHKLLDDSTHREEPGAGVQPLELGPGEHGSRGVGLVGENMLDVGGAPQSAIVHQEGHPVVAVTMTTLHTAVYNPV